jgi:polyribonucleotide nucleotidyltransferase
MGSPVAGETYQGTVVKLLDFGAFVDFGFSKDGMVHISEISPNRVEDIHSVLSTGDKVRVKFLGLDDRGRVKLSIKQAE